MHISHRKNNIEKTLKNWLRDALWLHLGGFGEALARFSGALGRSWGALGRSWGALGRSWRALGTLLGALGHVLDACWTQLAKNSKKKLNFLKPNLEPKIHSTWLQNPQKIDVKTFIHFEAICLVCSHVFHRFPIQSKNVDFVKNSVLPRENHDF